MISIAQQKEQEAWIIMCSEIQKLLGITKEEFNKRKDIRALMTKVANWGYYNDLLTTELRVKGKLKEGYRKPLFCDVDAGE